MKVAGLIFLAALGAIPLLGCTATDGVRDHRAESPVPLKDSEFYDVAPKAPPRRTPELTYEVYKKIAPGVSRREVLALLGGPPTGTRFDGVALSEGEFWRSGRAEIWVCFDKSDHVMRALYNIDTIPK